MPTYGVKLCTILVSKSDGYGIYRLGVGLTRDSVKLVVCGHDALDGAQRQNCARRVTEVRVRGGKRKRSKHIIKVLHVKQ
jgi:hypothetical protein